MYQEGLPAYWGIETDKRANAAHNVGVIRKDYPLTGVLKPISCRFFQDTSKTIRKDYPLTGVLKPSFSSNTCTAGRHKSGRITRLLGY